MEPAFKQTSSDQDSDKPAARHLSVVDAGSACQLPAPAKNRHGLQVALLAGLAGVSALFAYLLGGDGAQWLSGSLPNIWSRLIAQVGQVILVINVLTLLWRIYLVLTYKPMPACPQADLPTITVVVPAYNEGSQVGVTLHSVAESDYPAEKLQIISIDDGSQDDTWLWMQRAAAELPGRVTLLRQPRNMGKRHALYAAFKQATGQVLVTIDSDSVIEKETLRRLVAPMVADPVVGGVAGNVRVLNMKAGIIPRMLEVAFTFGFDFLRASHSRVNTVMCTPGALSAYRTDAVMPVLDQWLNETFLGKPYCIGEDRYLTNLILEQGYHILFQSNAMVFTNVPTKYKGLVRMLLRWARSDIRESLYMHKFVFKKFRKSSALGCRINLALSWIDMTICQVLMVSGMLSLLTLPPVVALYTLIGAAVVGLVPLTVYFIRHRNLMCLWAIPYSIFYVAALAWIPVYAILTVHKSGWLTRQITAKPQRRPWLQVARLTPVYASAGILAMVMGSGASLYVQRTPEPVAVLLAAAEPGDQIQIKGEGLTFTHSEDGAKRWHLAAAGSSLDRSSGVVNLHKVDVVFYGRQGKQVRLSADGAEFDPSDQSLSFEGNVRGTTHNGLRLATNSLVYYDDERMAETDDEVTLSGPSYRMRGQGMSLDLNKNRTVLRKPVTSRVSAMNQQPVQLAYLGS